MIVSVFVLYGNVDVFSGMFFLSSSLEYIPNIPIEKNRIKEMKYTDLLVWEFIKIFFIVLSFLGLKF